MQKCLIYGNCQIDHIQEYLSKNSKFTDIYSEIYTKKVHLLKPEEIPDLESMVSDIDLFIHQPISDNYRNMPGLGTNYLKTKLKPDCKIISFPVAYFTGYYPEMIYLKPLQNQVIKENIYNYHDFNILSGFYQGKAINNVVNSIFDEYFYSTYYIKNNFNLTISELAKREASLDVKLSQFIVNNYKKNNLFNTINHPHHPIIGYIVNCILEILSLPKQYKKDQLFDQENHLDYQNYFPIYPSVYKNLNLKFENKLTYKFKNITYSLENAIIKLYNFYDKNPELVEFNIQNKWDQFYRQSSKFSLLQNDNKDNKMVTALTSEYQLNNLDLDITLEISSVIEQLSELCDCLTEQEQFSEAIIITKSILELKPKNIRYWQKLAKLYEINQDFEQAISCSKQILNINSEHTNTYINLGRLYYKIKCFEEAIKYYNGGISLNPQQPPWVYRFLGNCLQELGYLEDAIAKYNHVLSLPTCPPMTYIELGNALKKQHRNQEAEQAYQKAIELNPQLSALVKSLNAK